LQAQRVLRQCKVDSRNSKARTKNMTRTLNSFIIEQIRANGVIYFALNYSGCIAHCRNQKRLWDRANDPAIQSQVARYVDALYDAGDIK
jgi:hypothetical protein